MNAILYQPDTTPEEVSNEGLVPLHGNAQSILRVADFLGCAPQLVDVLASGLDYVAYSIFDCEDRINTAAMQAVGELAGITFDAENDDEVLRGAVLVVRGS